MTWILWASLLIAHGAVSRWAKGSRFYAPASIISDGMLIAVALITVDQLQGMSILDTLRVGLFFVAFGTAGRQLMHSVLERVTAGPPVRPDSV